MGSITKGSGAYRVGTVVLSAGTWEEHARHRHGVVVQVGMDALYSLKYEDHGVNRGKEVFNRTKSLVIK